MESRERGRIEAVTAPKHHLQSKRISKLPYEMRSQIEISSADTDTWTKPPLACASLNSPTAGSVGQFSRTCWVNVSSFSDACTQQATLEDGLILASKEEVYGEKKLGLLLQLWAAMAVVAPPVLAGH